jgi:hypothetical protein
MAEALGPLLSGLLAAVKETGRVRGLLIACYFDR